MVNALARGEPHVPFRHTKLTALLRDSLGGNCRTIMVANIWPELVNIEEVMATLKFAVSCRPALLACLSLLLA